MEEFAKLCTMRMNFFAYHGGLARAGSLRMFSEDGEESFAARTVLHGFRASNWAGICGLESENRAPVIPSSYSWSDRGSVYHVNRPLIVQSVC